MLAYLDTFGASGGVGRTSREIIKECLKLDKPTAVIGESHIVDSYRPYSQNQEDLRFYNVTPRKNSTNRVWYELQKKGLMRKSSFTDFLMQSASRNLRQSGFSSSMLVNYPQEWEPPDKAGKYWILIYDINWRHFPGNFINSDLIDYRCQEWVKKAEGILTISEFTRDEILKYYNVPSHKIVAAPLAPFVFAPPSENILNAPSWNGLTAGQFYFYPAVLGLHKGHDTLAAALQNIDVFPLVVTCGQPNGKRAVSHEFDTYIQKLQPVFDALREKNKLVVLQSVSDENMAWLQVNCRGYVLPSLFEGFGFPLVEAMQVQRPVICSDIPAYNEILKRYDGRIRYAQFRAGQSEELAYLLEQDYSQTSIFKCDPLAENKNYWGWSDTVGIILDAIQA